MGSKTWNILIVLTLVHTIGCEDTEIIDLSEYGDNLFGKPNFMVGEFLNKWNKTEMEMKNPEEWGDYMEGDILVPRTSMARNGMVSEFSHWPEGVIPFEINGGFTAADMDIIEKALNDFHANTCIKFVRHFREIDFISIETENTGCWSSVGRIGGKQAVNLQSPVCTFKKGTVIHELLHAVGFLHEQNREERDNYVYIDSQNIRPGYENNFEKASKGSSSGYGVEYDYHSVLHYGANAFSINNNPTIIPKSNAKDIQMGQREGFSAKDIEKINRMYKCQSPTLAHEKPLTLGDVMNGIFG